MKQHLIFIAASDGTGYTYSNIYVSDIGVENNVIEACKNHFKTTHESAIYVDRGSIQIVLVDVVIGEYTSAKSCMESYEKVLLEIENAEVAELNRLKTKYPHLNLNK
jgi:hypothetical protein